VDTRLRVAGGVLLLIVAGMVGWWLSGAEPATEPEVVVPVASSPSPERPAAPPSAPAPAEDAVVVGAMQILADVEGAYVVRCPEPPEPLGRGPYLRRTEGLFLVSEPVGQGLVFAAPPRPGQRVATGIDALRRPLMLMRWGDAATGVGWCAFDPVEEVSIAGVVLDGKAPVVPSWVTGCGVAMQPVDPDGRFEVSVFVGEPCLLQAEGRGDGVWVNPVADLPEVSVPWQPREEGERQEVVDRLARSLEALEALDAMVDPLELVLERELDADTRAVLETMLADTQREQAGRRAWVERALERYSAPEPVPDDPDEEDRWPGLE
jgi:hypothetical protein